MRRSGDAENGDEQGWDICHECRISEGATDKLVVPWVWRVLCCRGIAVDVHIETLSFLAGLSTDERYLPFGYGCSGVVPT